MSHHDEGETCRKCCVLHYDGPAHICNPYAARWPEGPTDAEVKRGLNRLMSTMADMVTTLSAENRELKERAEKAEAEVTQLTKSRDFWQADALRYAQNVDAAQAKVTRLTAALERAKLAYHGRGGRGPDDPATCPFGHVDSCCGFHAECQAVAALEAQR